MTTAPAPGNNPEGPNGTASGSGPGRRRRRRKRKPGDPKQSTPGDAAAVSNASKAGGPGGGKKAHPKRRRGKPPASPVQLVERATTQPASSGPLDTETPLSPAEVASFKRHFAFLRDYKKTLKLKLNAQEDLLLEGSREPEGRGVCHHLLSKVDYATVQRALERIPEAERPRLIGGILAFKAELSFLLLYLEALQQAGHGQATRALEEALERIDFGQVSEGQMRRVLELIAQLFDEARRASLLFGMLESKSFRAAFDQSIGKLPDALAELVVPVRALQAVVLQGHPNPAGDEALLRGLTLAISDGFSMFERRPAKVRARLIELLASRAPERLQKNFGAVQRLLDGFSRESNERRELERVVVRALLALGQYDRAKKRVRELCKAAPNDDEFVALGRALEAPRFGRFALLRGTAGALVSHVNEAVLLGSEKTVWLRLAKAEDREALRAHAALHARLVLPGVARIVATNFDAEPASVALERRGEALLPNHPALKHREPSLAVFEEMAAFAYALCTGGFALPDLHRRRFELVAGPTLRLVNTWQLEETPAEQALSRLLASAKAELSGLRALSDSDRSQVENASDFPALFSLLHELRWGAGH